MDDCETDFVKIWRETAPAITLAVLNVSACILFDLLLLILFTALLILCLIQAYSYQRKPKVVCLLALGSITYLCFVTKDIIVLETNWQSEGTWTPISYDFKAIVFETIGTVLLFLV